MASVIIGRANCPECGFESAHVKESEKCLYRYCPECGSQHYARNQRQRADLMGKTRTTATGSGSPSQPVTAITTATDEPGATGSTSTDTATPPVAPPPKRRGLFS